MIFIGMGMIFIGMGMIFIGLGLERWTGGGFLGWGRVSVAYFGCLAWDFAFSHIAEGGFLGFSPFRTSRRAGFFGFSP